MGYLNGRSIQRLRPAGEVRNLPARIMQDPVAGVPHQRMSFRHIEKERAGTTLPLVEPNEQPAHHRAALPLRATSSSLERHCCFMRMRQRRRRFPALPHRNDGERLGADAGPNGRDARRRSDAQGSVEVMVAIAPESGSGSAACWGSVRAERMLDDSTPANGRRHRLPLARRSERLGAQANRTPACAQKQQRRQEWRISIEAEAPSVVLRTVRASDSRWCIAPCARRLEVDKCGVMRKWSIWRHL